MKRNDPLRDPNFDEEICIMNKPELQVRTYKYYDFYEFFSFLRQKFGRYIDQLENECRDIQGGYDFCGYCFGDYFCSGSSIWMKHELISIYPQISDYIKQELGTTSIALVRL